MGDLERAEGFATNGVADSHAVCVGMAKAIVRWKRGQPEEALAVLARYPIGTSEYYRGEILAGLGRHQEAIEAFPAVPSLARPELLGGLPGPLELPAEPLPRGAVARAAGPRGRGARRPAALPPALGARRPRPAAPGGQRGRSRRSWLGPVAARTAPGRFRRDARGSGGDPARGGDVEGAATAVLRRHGPAVQRFLRTALGNETLADDAQALFCEWVWRGIRSFEGRSSLRTWCFGVAANAARRVRGEPWRQRARRLSTTGEAALAAGRSSLRGAAGGARGGARRRPGRAPGRGPDPARVAGGPGAELG